MRLRAGKIHKNVIRPGLSPTPCWEAYSTHPDTITAGLNWEPTAVLPGVELAIWFFGFLWFF